MDIIQNSMQKRDERDNVIRMANDSYYKLKTQMPLIRFDLRKIKQFPKHYVFLLFRHFSNQMLIPQPKFLARKQSS